jgi:hypothetical protein
MSRIGSFLNRSNYPVHHSDDPKKNPVNNKKLAEYASPAQQRALEANDAQSLQIADDEALAWAIQASLNEQAESPALQNKTPTDAIAEQIANDEAIARAMQDNKKEAKAADYNTFYNETRGLEYINSNKLRNWLNQAGYRIVRNSGKNNNCLLISLLQHVTGNYKSQHSEEAARYKAILEKESNGDIGQLDPLYFDTHLIEALIKRMGEDYGREISINLYVAYDNGKLSERIIGSGAEQFTIFDEGEHFEAVLPPLKMDQHK